MSAENIESKSVISLRSYLEKGKPFRIPNYQRGYIWGKSNPKYPVDSVTNLLQSLDTVLSEEDKTVFLQGVTVIETDEEIILIDGQQRTTCLYIILRMLGWDGEFTLRYSIRSESDAELKKIRPGYDCARNDNEEYQDVFFFKRTARRVLKHFQGQESSFKDICEKILDRVRFLYIDIKDSDQQSLVFSMMNGNKADMKAEEIIKADLLRIASLTPKVNPNISDFNNDYSNDVLRSRHAREWDKWLYWWNRYDVSRLFCTNNKMLGWLIPITYCLRAGVQLDKKTADVSYKQFRDQFLANADYKTAKSIFEHLRRIQKRFEDIYNDPISYNYTGAILKMCGREQQLLFLRWFFDSDNLLIPAQQRELRRYYKWCFLDHTHKEIIDNAFNEEKFLRAKAELLQYDVYNDKGKAYPRAQKWLLMKNIEEDCKQNEESERGRKFDFSIWDNKSLEHIFPKSKVSHQDPNNPLQLIGGDDHTHPKEDYLIKREDFGPDASEHSIGNLVLLYGPDNSSFGALTFEEKKDKFFSLKDTNIFHSRHLIHTISIFAHSKWDIPTILKNQKDTEQSFDHFYQDYRTDNQ